MQVFCSSSATAAETKNNNNSSYPAAMLTVALCSDCSNIGVGPQREKKKESESGTTLKFLYYEHD